MAFLSNSSWMGCPSYHGFLNGVLQRMYKSIFSTCITRRMKGPRLCQQCSGGLSEYHSFIVRRWPNLDCIYRVGGKNGPVSDYFWALNVLTGFVQGLHWLLLGKQSFLEGVPHVLEQWCILACLVLPKWVDSYHIYPHVSVLDGVKKELSDRTCPADFYLFYCMAFKASSYYIICRLVPAKQILSWRLWPCKGLVKVVGPEVCT